MSPSTSRTVRVGTRRSLLATTQSGHVAEMVEGLGMATELVEITTDGDRSQAAGTPLVGSASTGVFVNALRDALVGGEVDLAVHSLKDLPTYPCEGVTLVVVPPREDPRDVVVARDDLTLGELPVGSRVGTGSPRRAAQLHALGLGLEVVPIRGNVDTRIRAVREGTVDAVLLARAGLARIGRVEEATEVLDPLQVLPAPGQGALAVECRSDDTELLEALAALDDPRTRAAVEAGDARRRGRTAGPARSGHRIRTGATSMTRGKTTARTETPTTARVGWVSFVGAGPGDPELLTVRAVELLKQAEVVVTESPEHAELVRRVVGLEPTDEAAGPEIVDGGFGEDGQPLTHAARAKVVVKHAKKGGRVVRLMTGDPFTYASGPEEAQACAKACIGFEIVPGISSVAGVPAYAGIPLTSKDHREVAVVTCDGTVDWSRYADDRTLVLLSGVGQIGDIAKQLVAAGRPATTPVAVTRVGTTTEQSTVTSTLAEVAADVRAARIAPPAVIVRCRPTCAATAPSPRRSPRSPSSRRATPSRWTRPSAAWWRAATSGSPSPRSTPSRPCARSSRSTASTPAPSRA